MKDLYTELESLSKGSDFSATLSQRGGYVTFSNSGRRGGTKYFQIGLDNLLQTLKDILENITEFAGMTEYVESDWRNNGSAYFKDPVANANSTVQTKPLFSTLSKLIIWGNQPTYDNVDSDQKIVLDEEALRNTIDKLEAIADAFKPAVTSLTSSPKSYDTTAQTIFYGCPGTGKSFKVKGLTEGHDGTKAIYFDKETGKRIDTPDTEEERMSQPSNVFRTTFHPDYDYSTFVGAYKPQMKTVEVMVSENNENTTVKEEVLRYTFVPQVFTNAYVRAWKSLMDDELVGEEKNVYLIIEEINRGNCAQIFGDLFQLLDRSDGNSDYAIIPDEELRKHLEEQGVPSSRLRLPANLHIYATMNTSDQSLFPMDSAFKRRWEMEYIPINLKHDLASTYTIEFDGHKFMWTDFLKAVNTLIRKATDSEDKQMGEFFVKNKVINLAEFKNKVLFYIWNDVCKDLYGASRVSPLYFMRDTEKTIFTFAELYSGRTNEDETVTEPIDLILGFMSYLKVEDKGTAAKKDE